MSVDDRVTKLEEELKNYKKLATNTALIAVTAVVLLTVFLTSISKSDGLYMVYAPKF